MIRDPDRNNLREKGIVSANGSKALSIAAEKAQRKELERTVHILSTGKSRDNEAVSVSMTVLSSLSLSV